MLKLVINICSLSPSEFLQLVVSEDIKKTNDQKLCCQGV